MLQKISLETMKIIASKKNATGCTFILAGKGCKKLTLDDFGKIRILLESLTNARYTCVKDGTDTMLYVSVDDSKQSSELFCKMLVILDRMQDIDNNGVRVAGTEFDCKMIGKGE